MSYQSRLFQVWHLPELYEECTPLQSVYILVVMQSTWTYEPFDTTADDFNSKVGRVLNRGAYEVGNSDCQPAVSNDHSVSHAQVLSLQGQLHKSSSYASSIAQQEAVVATTHPLSGSAAELNSFVPAAATSVFAAQGPCQYTWV